MPKELRAKRILCKILFTVFFLVIPFIVINHYYGLFQTYSKNALKITGGTVIAVLLVYTFLRNRISKWFEALNPGWLKKILHAFAKSIPMIIILILAKGAMDEMQKFVRTIEYCSVSIIIAYIAEAFEADYNQEWNEIKLLKRQDTYRSKYNL